MVSRSSNRGRAARPAIEDYRRAYRACWKRDPPEEIRYENGWVVFERSGFKPLRVRLAPLIWNTERLRLR